MGLNDSMFTKMQPFPSRKAGLLRFIIPACLILICLYYWNGPVDTFPYNTGLNHQPALSPTTPTNAATQPPFKTPIAQDSESQGELQKPSAAPPSTSSSSSPTSTSLTRLSKSTHTGATAAGAHPIDHLIEVAEKNFQDAMAKESRNVADAAAAYRRRRGRHPPPGFDKWFEFAKERNAVMVEDFWDQIYHDLTPFWAIPAPKIRMEARRYEMTINVRNRVATAGSEWFWTKIWLNMTKTVEHLLPDMDIALNAMDEPRLIVPWEQMRDYVSAAAKTVKLPDAKDVVDTFEKLPSPTEASVSETKSDVKLEDKAWERERPYWAIARRGCDPKSASRKAEMMTNFDHAPQISDSLASPHMYQGFVSNFTLSSDFCHQPDLQGLEGIFIDPLSVATTKTLFPMFGGSKLAVNNEILLPAPMYWSEEERFTGGGNRGAPWSEKKAEVVWRGVATGGHNHAGNWKGFQRHRFVAMNNVTKLSDAEDWSEIPLNFVLPSQSYHLKPQKDKHLGKWAAGWANVSFTDFMCDKDGVVNDTCSYMAPHFEITKGVSMQEMFKFKFLPDIDGNSFSGRYLGFLRSTSLPIKATLWREWHDSRLIPWKHFVPMDNRFGDWFGIMEYFLGYGDAAGHDAAAEKMATDGQEWADKVLRKEDMQIYVLRLLLEYARLSDERRERMGWVGDLLSSSS